MNATFDQKGYAINEKDYETLLRNVMSKEDITSETQYHRVIALLSRYLRPLRSKYSLFLQFCSLCNVGTFDMVLGKVPDFEVFLITVLELPELTKISDYELGRLIIAVGSATFYGLGIKIDHLKIDPEDEDHVARLWEALRPVELLSEELSFLSDPMGTSCERLAIGVNLELAIVLDYQAEFSKKMKEKEFREKIQQKRDEFKKYRKAKRDEKQKREQEEDYRRRERRRLKQEKMQRKNWNFQYHRETEDEYIESENHRDQMENLRRLAQNLEISKKEAERIQKEKEIFLETGTEDDYEELLRIRMRAKEESAFDKMRRFAEDEWEVEPEAKPDSPDKKRGKEVPFEEEPVVIAEGKPILPLRAALRAGRFREEEVLEAVSADVKSSMKDGFKVKHVYRLPFNQATLTICLFLLLLTLVMGGCPGHFHKYNAEGKVYYFPPSMMESERIGSDCEHPVLIHGCTNHLGKPTERCQRSCMNGTWSSFCEDVSTHAKQYVEGKCYCGRHSICRETIADFGGFKTKSWTKEETTECSLLPNGGEISLSQFPQLRHMRSLSHSLKERDGEENCVVYFSLEGKSLVIKSGSHCLIQVRVEKSSWFEEHDYYCPIQTSLRLPEAIFLSDGVIRVLAVLPTGQIIRNSFQISEDDYCPEDACFFCSDTFNHIDCGGYLRAFGLFIICCCLVSAFVILSYNIFKLSFCCLSFGWKCGKLGFKVSKIAVKSTSSSRLTSRIRDLISTDDDEESLRPLKVSGDKKEGVSLAELISRGSKISIRSPAMMLIMCVLLVCPMNAKACDGNSLIITAQSETCIISGVDTENCTAFFEIDAIMTFKGSEVCFTLTSSDNHTYVNGKVRYSGTESLISLENLYVTSFWTGVSESRHRCYDAGPCDAGSCHRCCDDKTADGQLSEPEIVNYPGHSRCRRSCGCATCGCFLCDDSCVYSGFGIIPIANKYYVKTSNGQSWTPKISFSITDFVETRVFDVSGDGSSVSMGNLDFSVDLIQKPVASAFPPDGRKFVVETNSMWTYAEFASDLNSPQRGNIGDIQANTVEDLVNPTVNSFIFSEEIFSIAQQSKLDSYTFEQSGLLNNGLKNKLPRIISGDLWDTNGNYIWSDLNNPGPIRASISAAGTGFTFVRKISLVCPVADLLNASGCYSCQQGAMITIEAKSTCGPGLVFVKVDDPSIIVSTASLTITTTMTSFVIDVETTTKENEFTMHLIGNGGNTSFVVRFTATFDPLVRNDSTYKNDTQGGDGDGDGDGIGDIWGSVEDFFKSIFNFDSSWWEYLIIVVVLIALLFNLAVLLYFCWPVLLRLILGCFSGGRFLQSRIKNSMLSKKKST